MDEQEALRRHLSRLGKKGGPIGGRARMASLTPKQRTELAKKAAAARWKNREEKPTMAKKQAAKKAAANSAEVWSKKSRRKRLAKGE
jgi:hypothetical protein